jgi:hypothetical protein
MNSRERRGTFDPTEILIRESLQERAGKAPRPELRRQVLQRAARQQRRLAWRLPPSLSRVLSDSPSVRYSPWSPENHMLSVEALFGLRLGWFSYNHLMR